MASNFITFRKVKFSYNANHSPLLNDCSFELSIGDRLVIQCESGTGKTTIFRLLLGFEQPDEGKILYKNQSLNKEIIQQFRKETAWLPQDLDLGQGSLYEVLLYPFEFEANASQRPERDEILKTLKSLGLSEDMCQTKFEDLSTGQRQRVGIALCHLLNKPLILLDEPTSALDKASKQRVVDLLFTDNDRTILSTSHDPWWIEQCNKVVELNT